MRRPGGRFSGIVESMIRTVVQSERPRLEAAFNEYRRETGDVETTFEEFARSTVIAEEGVE